MTVIFVKSANRLVNAPTSAIVPIVNVNARIRLATTAILAKSATRLVIAPTNAGVPIVSVNA